jgi:hypothetical protein
MKYKLFLGIFLLFNLTGCFQIHNDDRTYHTVPTTNNPNIIPNHATFKPS